MDEQTINAIDELMSRSADFSKGKPFEVDREMDAEKVEPVHFGGHAVFAEDARVRELELQLTAIQKDAPDGSDEEDRLIEEIEQTREAGRAERAKKRVVTFKTTTTGLDRHGTKIITDGIDTTNYDKNPIFAWAHDAYGSFFSSPAMENIIGRNVAMRKAPEAMEQDILFATADINPKGDQAFRMVMNRFLNATSIGFIPKEVVIEMHDERNVPVITKSELLETSLVPIPSNPDALAILREMAVADVSRHGGVSLQWACRHGHPHATVDAAAECNERPSKEENLIRTDPGMTSSEVRAMIREAMAQFTVELLGATSFTDLPLSSRTAPWDAGAARSSLGDDMALWKKAHFWFDSGAPDLKGSYKLPFARKSGSTLQAVWRGVTAAAQRLDQTDLPAGDKEKIRRHMERYYSKAAKQFNDDSIVPPWKKSAESPEPESVRDAIHRAFSVN